MYVIIATISIFFFYSLFIYSHILLTSFFVILTFFIVLIRLRFNFVILILFSTFLLNFWNIYYIVVWDNLLGAHIDLYNYVYDVIF